MRNNKKYRLQMDLTESTGDILSKIEVRGMKAYFVNKAISWFYSQPEAAVFFDDTCIRKSDNKKATENINLAEVQVTAESDKIDNDNECKKIRSW